MRAILINAGQGSRLLPLTLHTPKCLVAVNGKCILDHQIEALHEAGVARIEVVGGYRAAQIHEHLSRHYDPGRVGLTINPFWSVASSIGSVWAVREYLDEPFVLVNGDTIFDASVFQQAMADMRPGVNLVVEPVTTPEHDDMLVQVRQGCVVAVGKQLGPQQITHRSLGIVLSPDSRTGGLYLTALRAVIEAEGGYNAYHHGVIDQIARHAAVTAIENHSGLWREVDRPEDIERWTRDHDPQAMAPRDVLTKRGRGPVAFFFLGETLLIPHLYPIVEALAKHGDVLIDLWVSTSAQEELLRGWIQELGPATVRLRRVRGYRTLSGVEAGSNAVLRSKSRLLLGMIAPMLRTPVAVVAEQTSLWLPALLPLRTRFINVSHGHGSIRSRDSLRRRAAWLMPVPSQGEQKALVDLGFAAAKVPVVGSVKSTFRHHTGRQIAFAEKRPVVLYNPHWQPHRSSWWDWGPQILQQLVAQDRFNIILAPHQRLVEGDPALRQALAAAARHPHVLSDVESFAMVDGSYQRVADIYLGDTSSQVIEFLVRPRPCLFLNNKHVPWRTRGDYAMWQAGEVLEEPAQLLAALDRAVGRHGDYLGAQQQLVCDWLGDTSGAPERIVGHILEALAPRA